MVELQCDDGNTLSGDGCSATCEVENNYLCQGGTPTTPSQCTFRVDINIVVESMRGLGGNSGRLTLSLTPPTDLFAQMDFKARTLFFIDGNFQVITETIYS